MALEQNDIFSQYFNAQNDIDKSSKKRYFLLFDGQEVLPTEPESAI